MKAKNRTKFAHHTAVRIPHDIYDKLKHTAERDGTKVGTLINLALAEKYRAVDNGANTV